MFPSPIFAITTPFDENGDLAEKAFVESLHFWTDGGVSAIIVGGTTGEFPSLALGERLTLYRLAREHFPGVILQNISSPSYRDVRTLAEASPGADGFLLLPPYYYAGIKDEGLIAFYQKALEGFRTPTLLYHFPKHSKLPFALDLVRRLREACPQIVGLKDSGGDFAASRAFQALGNGFQLYSASSATMLQALQAGMAGLISGSGLPFPACLVGLVRAFQNGQADQASHFQAVFDKWSRFRKDLGANGEAVAKYALSLRVPGYPSFMRPPLPELTQEQKQQVQAFLRDIDAEIVLRSHA